MPIDLELEYRPRMPRNRERGIGCVGAGFIMSDCHLPAYREAGFRPVAIHSRTPERAEETARRHEIARVHERLEALIEDPAVEIVDIAVPPHEQLASFKALEGEVRGDKAVALEKQRRLLCGLLLPALSRVAETSLRDRALLVPRARAERILLTGNTEQDDRTHTESREIGGFSSSEISGQAEMPGHRLDGSSRRAPFDHEQRRDQLRGRQEAHGRYRGLTAGPPKYCRHRQELGTVFMPQIADVSCTGLITRPEAPRPRTRQLLLRGSTPQ